MGPITNDRHERLNEITAMIEYFGGVGGGGGDPMKLVGVLLDGSDMFLLAVRRYCSYTMINKKIRALIQIFHAPEAPVNIRQDC